MKLMQSSLHTDLQFSFSLLETKRYKPILATSSQLRVCRILTLSQGTVRFTGPSDLQLPYKQCYLISDDARR